MTCVSSAPSQLWDLAIHDFTLSSALIQMSLWGNVPCFQWTCPVQLSCNFPGPYHWAITFSIVFVAYKCLNELMELESWEKITKFLVIQENSLVNMHLIGGCFERGTMASAQDGSQRKYIWARKVLWILFPSSFSFLRCWSFLVEGRRAEFSAFLGCFIWQPASGEAMNTWLSCPMKGVQTPWSSRCLCLSKFQDLLVLWHS